MPSDKSEPIRITGSRFVGGSVVLVDLIKSVGIDIYTTSESDASLCKACATRVNVEDSVANLMCLPVEKTRGYIGGLKSLRL